MSRPLFPSSKSTVRENLLAYGKFVLAFFTIVATVIAVYVIPQISDAWSAWKNATSSQWLGSLLLIAATVVIFYLPYVTLRHHIRAYFSSATLTLTISKSATHFKQYIAKCLRDVCPKGSLLKTSEWKAKRTWQHLATAFVDSYSDECTALRDRGHEERRLLPSNFQVYAKCVAALLREAENLRLEGTVWTLLKRPLTDWYNLFPLVIRDRSSEVRAVFTTRWWETYKSSIQRLRDSDASRLKIKRLVVMPPQRGFTEDNSSDVTSAKYCVLHRSNGAYDLTEETPSRPENRVTLLSEVEALLDADAADIPRKARLHLVGTSEDQSLPDEWQELVSNFEQRFHTGSGAHRDAELADVGGVYYRYTQTTPAEFRDYDDIFMFRCRNTLFGIALCFEEDLDTGGILILKNNELARFEEVFVAAWNHAFNHLDMSFDRGRTICITR